MRLKLFLLLALFATLPMLAQRAGVQGVVIDAKSGQPVVGATVILDNQGNAATTDTEGSFIIDDANPGPDQLLVLAYGYNDWSGAVTIVAGMVENLGTIQVEPVSFESAQALEFRNAVADMALSESQLEDEEGNTQEVALPTTPSTRHRATHSAPLVSASVVMRTRRPRPTSTACRLMMLSASRSTTR